MLKPNFRNTFKTLILEFEKKHWNFARKGNIFRTAKERQKLKQLFCSFTDIEERKRSYQIGFDTLLVYAVNYEC